MQVHGEFRRQRGIELDASVRERRAYWETQSNNDCRFIPTGTNALVWIELEVRVGGGGCRECLRSASVQDKKDLILG